jgi:L-lysine 2,3-aminomutase
MADPSSIRVDIDALLKDLINLPQLKDKVLVTTVYRCPAYCRYISAKGP